MKQTTRHGAGIGSFLILLLALAPGMALAQVKITEIMYDAPGADSGREWIEVTNTGSEPIDAGKYKLLESGTHHGLTLVSGSKVLPAGSSAIIAADAKKFAADNPAYAGALFDSAFSLSNTGEILEIEDASTSPLDSASYSAAVGAGGEGGSLHLHSGAFVAFMPNPGVYPGDLIAVPVPAAKAVPVKKSTATTATKSTRPKTTYYNKTATGSPTFKEPATQPASAASAGDAQIPPLYLWISGCAAVVMLGMAGVILLLLKKSETSLSAAEFKIE